MNRSQILEWLIRGEADTRTPGAPAPRWYGSPSRESWEAVVEEVRDRRGWTVELTDEEEGLVVATCRSPLLRARYDLAVWVTSEAPELTRLDARSTSRTSFGDLGAATRRIRRLWRSLDRRLDGGDSRSRPPRGEPPLS